MGSCRGRFRGTMRTTVLTPLALLLTLTACDQFGPEPTLSYAATMLWCGPADEGYTAIVLAKEPVTSREAALPYVGIGVTESVSRLAERTWSVTGDSASASYITQPNKSERALSGSITITSVDSASTVIGSVSLRFPSRIVEMPFTAPWINTGMTCP
jgi:hypothetical protein